MNKRTTVKCRMPGDISFEVYDMPYRKFVKQWRKALRATRLIELENEAGKIWIINPKQIMFASKVDK